MTPPDLAPALAACAAALEPFLAARLAGADAPPRLRAAMEHATLDGGKRLRPFLVQEAAALFGMAPDAARPTAAALEMIHCYSLVHDDLPDMDDDAIRRGRPTVWKAFDPALAILAGDALQTEAFALLADPATHPDPGVRVALVAVLARAAGASGMVGGQVLDIEGETNRLDEDAIFAMQAKKTGALIRAGAEMGAVLAGADDDARTALVRYGTAAGLAFQIADDILDVTATSETLGKTAGKDLAQNKSTIVARRGLAGARDVLEGALAEGQAALAPFGPRAQNLSALLAFIAERQS